MKNMTLLIVDDEEKVLKALNRTLKDEDYRILSAHSGHDAIDLIQNREINVVLTDLLMPEMDGLTLLKKIKDLNPDIVRLVLSSSAESHTILEAINFGSIYRYILKPWNDMELKILLRQAMQMYSLKKEKEDLLKKLEEHNLMLEKLVEERTEQLLKAEKMAMIGKHTSQIVHNLNNVLTPFYGIFHIISTMLPEGNTRKIKEYCDDGIGCLEKMRDIIMGILNHARDKSQFVIQLVDINKLIKEEDLFFTMNYEYNYNIERHLRLDRHLPPVKGNPSQIKQIIDNLIKNAIDAMENSAGKELFIQTSTEDRMIVIDITDTGEGIDSQNIHLIFNSDYTTKPMGKGTGLGLASVKSMVESYNGGISVRSEKGRGTTFKVMLPAA